MKIQELLDKAQMSGAYTTGRALSYIKDGLQEVGLYTDDLIKTGSAVSTTSKDNIFKSGNVSDSSQLLTGVTDWAGASDDGVTSTDSTPPTNWIGLNVADNDNDVYYGHISGSRIAIRAHTSNTLSDDGSTPNEYGALRQSVTIKNNIKTYVTFGALALQRQWYVKAIPSLEGSNSRHNSNSADLFRVRALKLPTLMEFYNCDSIEKAGVSYAVTPELASWSNYMTFNCSFIYNNPTKETGEDTSIHFVFGIDNMTNQHYAAFEEIRLWQNYIQMGSSYAGFNTGMKLQIKGSTSNDNTEVDNGYYTIKYSDGAGKLYVDELLTEETASSYNTTLTATENLYMDLINNKRFYSIPYDALEIKDIRVKNHLNDKNEYRSIPRMVYEPDELDEDDI